MRSASTASTRAAATSRPSWRRSSRTTSGPSASACRRKPRRACVIEGASNCRQFITGHKFTLEQHFNADGAYVLTGVTHFGARLGRVPVGHDGRVHLREQLHLHPRRLCLSGPPRTTPKPVVQGTQTAVVVGPGGRGDLHGQVRPGEGAVPLGPRGQERRRQLLLDPRRAALGGQAAGARPSGRASARR